MSSSGSTNAPTIFYNTASYSSTVYDAKLATLSVKQQKSF